MPLLVYTLLRIALVIAAGGVLYLLGLRGLLLVGLAVVVGALLSYVLLPAQRRDAAGALQSIAEREPRASTPDADARAEDAELDAVDEGGSAVGLPEGERERERRAED